VTRTARAGSFRRRRRRGPDDGVADRGSQPRLL